MAKHGSRSQRQLEPSRSYEPVLTMTCILSAKTGLNSGGNAYTLAPAWYSRSIASAVAVKTSSTVAFASPARVSR